METERRTDRRRFAVAIGVGAAALGLAVTLLVTDDGKGTTVVAGSEADGGTTATIARTTADGTTLTVTERRRGDDACDVVQLQLTASNPAWPDEVVTTAEVTGRPKRWDATVLRTVEATSATIVLLETGPELTDVALNVGDDVDQTGGAARFVALAVPSVGPSAVQWSTGTATRATGDRGNGRFAAPEC